MPSYKAGQFLSVQLEIEGKVCLRNYSISCGEKKEKFRISVKREVGERGALGKVSNFLHDGIQQGDELKVIN